jgi:site-specific recombinase XerD
VAALLKQCSHQSPTGIRNAAIVSTLWRTGIRCEELLELRPKDINRSGGHLQVLHGKGDKQRTVSIDGNAIARIDRWLDVRRDLGISGHRPLFCTLWGSHAAGQRLDDSYMRRLLPRLARAAGVDRRVHPHSLRHTLAYEWMMEGIPIATISAQLGHESIATTAIYLQHIAPKDLVAAMRSRPDWDNTDEE